MLDKIFCYIFKVFKVVKEICKILVFISFFVFAAAITNIFGLEQELAAKIGLGAFLTLMSLAVIGFVLDSSIAIYKSGELMKKSIDVLRKSNRIIERNRRNRIKVRRRIMNKRRRK